MKTWTRLSFFTKNLLLSFINIILIGTLLIASSYLIQKSVLIDQLHSQIEKVTESWYQQIDAEDVRQAVAEQSYDGPVQTKLRETLDTISKYNPNVNYAYIFGVELENGRGTSIVAMPTPLRNDFEAAEMGVGAMYEQPVIIADAVGKMLNAGNPTFSDIYSDDFGTWTTLMYPLKDSSNKIFAYFAVDVDASAVPKGLTKTLWTGIAIMALFFVIFFVVQYIVVKRTLSPIKELIHGIEEVSEGNLNIRIKAGVDDLGVVNDKFNTMVERINTTMARVQFTTDEVNESAKELLAICEQNGTNANTINDNINEITDNIKSQEQSSINTARSMSEMASVIQTIAVNASSLASEADSVQQRSVEGNMVAQQAAEQMHKITDSVKNTSRAIRLLESRSQEIGNILNIISGISSQTNLLALNASIEAARVGEEGKGFAVVAGEVRKLAEQSQAATQQITGLIEEVQKEIKEASIAMETGTMQVEEGIAVTEKAGSLFENILGATRSFVTQIEDLSSSTEQISAGTQEMTATAEELSSTVSKTASNSGYISQTVEEQKASTISIIDSSNKLSSMSEELRELISYFKVSNPS